MLLTGYHGCDLRIAEAVMTYGVRLIKSETENEWLGTGIYFWVGSLEMAKQWALQGRSNGWISHPAVLQMTIDTGNCLDFTNLPQPDELVDAYTKITQLCEAAGLPMLVNEKVVDGVPINRKLDCAVIDYLHTLRRLYQKARYDTVMGAFEDGLPMFPGSPLKTKRHVQIAVVSYNSLSNPLLAWRA